MKISIRYFSNSICKIEMNNSIIERGLIFKSIRYNKVNNPMPHFIKVVKQFAKGNEFFFGFCRTDGINLTKEEWIQYDKEIPKHFQTNGRYEPLPIFVQKKQKVKDYTGILTVGSLPINDGTYELLPKVFHYYLETIVFCPKINWGAFVETYQDYMKHSTDEYVLQGFTNFLFAYSDSGDFSISFDPNMYDPKAISDKINEILLT